MNYETKALFAYSFISKKYLSNSEITKTQLTYSSSEISYVSKIKFENLTHFRTEITI